MAEAKVDKLIEQGMNTCSILTDQHTGNRWRKGQSHEENREEQGEERDTYGEADLLLSINELILSL